MHFLVSSVLSASIIKLRSDGLTTGRFEYAFEGVQYDGYVALPRNMSKNDGLLPTALVIHGAMGEGKNEQFRAEQLARLGFAAFAVDLFGQDKRFETAFGGGEAVSQSYSNMTKLHRQLGAQIKALASRYPADPDNAIVAGYCYGGNIALEYVRGDFPYIHAAVSFHGTFMGANSTTMVEPLNAAVQVHHADDDFQELDFSGGGGGSWGPAGIARRKLQLPRYFSENRRPRKEPSVLTELEGEMRKAGLARWTTLRYGRTGHAWTYPEGPEYKEFESVSAHDASFALYRQLGIVGGTVLPSPAPPCQPCPGGSFASNDDIRRLLFASTEYCC